MGSMLVCQNVKRIQTEISRENEFISENCKEPNHKLMDTVEEKIIFHSAYGKIQVIQSLKSPYSQQKFAVKTIFLKNLKEFQRTLSLIQSKYKSFLTLSEPCHVVKLIMVKHQVKESLCSNSYRIFLVFEYHMSTLALQIKENIEESQIKTDIIPQSNDFKSSGHMKHSSIKEVNIIANSLLSILKGVSELHSIGSIYNDIRPETIVQNQAGHIFVTNIAFFYSFEETTLNFTCNKFKKIFEKQMHLISWLISPEEFFFMRGQQVDLLDSLFKFSCQFWGKRQETVDEIRDLNDQTNQIPVVYLEKSDVFRVGLTLLQLIIGKNIQKIIYDYEVLKINEQFIKKVLHDLMISSERDLKQLLEIIEQMIEFNPSNRLSISEALTKVNTLISGIENRTNRKTTEEVKKFEDDQMNFSSSNSFETLDKVYLIDSIDRKNQPFQFKKVKNENHVKGKQEKNYNQENALFATIIRNKHDLYSSINQFIQQQAISKLFN